MSIASEITRLQGVKSDILTAIADKGVTVPADSALDDCPGLIASIDSDSVVTIGGRAYLTTKIGNQLWMSENLDYKFSGIDIGIDGVPTTPAAWYYNNDEATYGKNGNRFGLLYNYYAVELMIASGIFPQGWRVPTKSDCLELISNGGSAGVDLKSRNFWNSGAGTNTTGFFQIPSAYRHDTGGFYEVGVQATLWTSSHVDDDPSELPLRMAFTTSSVGVSSNGWNEAYGYSIRLVKD